MSILQKYSFYSSQLKQYGLLRCLYRLWYDFAIKTGFKKRNFRPFRWEDKPLIFWVDKKYQNMLPIFKKFHGELQVHYFFPIGHAPIIDNRWLQDAITDSQLIMEGKLRYFSDQIGKTGLPFDWFLNPFTGYRETQIQHWCEISDFGSQRGDIKFFWEPARFNWAYTLARAYTATADEKYPEIFWSLWESFINENPPYIGLNWKCGQEIALRIFACIFALHVFWNSRHTTEQKVSQMVAFLAVSAHRIAKNINYAISQKSNHAVSEAAGLYIVGLLFPELKDAAYWKQLGRKVVENEVRRHNYPDGSYVQHSMNYQRMTLQLCVQIMRLAELNKESFSALVKLRLRASYLFLFQCQDPQSGCVPNYGANDGSTVLPLSSCEYLDYKPTLGACYYLFENKLLYPPGPWQECVLWLFGENTKNASQSILSRKSCNFDYGGYYTLRAGDSWAMVRCHTYRNRPSQADMLHLDLWWKGLNILTDSGTYQYFVPDNWNHYFLSTAAHNTIMLADTEQMTKGPHFMWADLVKSQFLRRAHVNNVELWQGEHYGYQRLHTRAVCRRTICRIDESYWLVVDDVFGFGKEKADIFWHLPDYAYNLSGNTLHLTTPQGPVSVILYSWPVPSKPAVCRGETEKKRLGWQSLYYGQKRPVPTFHMSVHGDLPLRFITLIVLGKPVKCRCEEGKVITWSSQENKQNISVGIPDLGAKKELLHICYGTNTIDI